MKSKEEVKEYNKEYYKRNKKKIYESTLKWQKNNPDKVKEVAKKWRDNNKKKNAKFQKDYRKKNLKHFALRALKYRKKYPEKEIAHRLAKQIPLHSKCQICSYTNKLERHHWRYDKPLLVPIVILKSKRRK